MRSLTRSFWVASLTGSAIAALGGCGESEKALETTTTTVSVEREQPPSQPKPEKVKPPSLSEQAEVVVRDYYAAVDTGPHLRDRSYGLALPDLHR